MFIKHEKLIWRIEGNIIENLFEECQVTSQERYDVKKLMKSLYLCSLVQVEELKG